MKILSKGDIGDIKGTQRGHKGDKDTIIKPTVPETKGPQAR